LVGAPCVVFVQMLQFFRVSASVQVDEAVLRAVHSKAVFTSRGSKTGVSVSFYRSRSLSMVRFETGVKLSQIEDLAFSSCASLSSVRFPSILEVLCKYCFCNGMSFSV
jgi:hypothetical protein